MRSTHVLQARLLLQQVPVLVLPVPLGVETALRGVKMQAGDHGGSQHPLGLWLQSCVWTEALWLSGFRVTFQIP